MKPESSLLHSQHPSTCPYPEPDRSSLCLHPTSRRSILILFSHLRLGLPSSSFCQVSALTPFMHLSSLPYVLHVLPISVFLTWSPEWYFVRCAEHKAPCYVFFSTTLLPRPSKAQISSSAPYSRKPSAYVLPNCKRPSSTPISNNGQNYSSTLQIKKSSSLCNFQHWPNYFRLSDPHITLSTLFSDIFNSWYNMN